MTAAPKPSMTVEEFVAWANRRQGAFELHDGVPVAMSPEWVIHGDTKYRVARALDAAIGTAGVPCRFVLDSAAVRIDERILFQPDAMVICGEPVARDAVVLENPVIVVEVLSPGNALTDLRDKFLGCFRLASVRHYLIVDPDKRIVIHHARGDGDTVAARIARDGTLQLDPPGLAIEVGALFG